MAVLFLYHWKLTFGVASVAVNKTEPRPLQKVVGPPAVTVGLAGVAYNVTMVAAEAVDGQLAGDALVTTTV